MKVFVLQRGWADECDVLAVYLSKEKAEAELERLRSTDKSYGYSLDEADLIE